MFEFIKSLFIPKSTTVNIGYSEIIKVDNCEMNDLNLDLTKEEMEYYSRELSEDVNDDVNH